MTPQPPTTQELLGLATGLVFGALLHRGRLAESPTIVGQVEGRDWRVATTMGTAVVVGGLGAEWLRRQGKFAIDVKPMRSGGVLAGGALFGAGMALGGYCPGTALAGAGAGRRDARWALAGMLAGAGAFVQAYPKLKPLIDAGDLGKRRLPIAPARPGDDVGARRCAVRTSIGLHAVAAVALALMTRAPLPVVATECAGFGLRALHAAAPN